MIDMTDAQREALERVFNRTPLYDRARLVGYLYSSTRQTITEADLLPFRLSLEEFIAMACPGSGCIMIQWCGMWLGIEEDGYTHS